MIQQLSQNSLLIQGATLDDIHRVVRMTFCQCFDEKFNEASIKKEPEAPLNGLYRRIDAASYLQVSTVTLDKWNKAGIIKSRRIGNRVYYTKKDLDNALVGIS